jgi:hypothetical protein
MNRVPDSISGRLTRGVEKASALVRFHRQDQALAQLDGLTALLEGPRGERVRDAARAELTRSIAALRTCVSAAQPQPLAAITVRVFEEGGRPAGEGVFVDAEGVRIGPTGPDGTLQAAVPSGTIRIQATEYPGSIGSAVARLQAGASASIAVVMAEGKEPSEDSDLVLEEAPADILAADPASLTFKFVQDGSPVRLDHIEDINVSDERDTFGEDLEEFFDVRDGELHARAPSAAYRRMAAQIRIGRPLWLAVSAVDTEGRSHYGALPLLIGQFKLDVVLAAPPSNPALQVSNIPVRVSIAGTDVAIKRTSDAHGRFQIDAVPAATLLFEGHTVASGIHYYTNATLTMCADRSVTVVMANVTDLVAGVRGVSLGPGTQACPDVPRR